MQTREVVPATNPAAAAESIVTNPGVKPIVSKPESLRGRFKERLQKERADKRGVPAEPAPTAPVALAPEPIVEPAATVAPVIASPPIAEVPAEIIDPTVAAEPDAGTPLTPDPASVSADGVADPVEGTIEYFQSRVEELEGSSDSKERDYRQKTQNVAALRRTMEDDIIEVDQVASYYASIADTEVKRFEGLNWQQLRTEPEKYQQAREQFGRAVQNRDRQHAIIGKMREQHAAKVEQAKDREAEVSKDILSSTIKGWSPARFGELRDFAVTELQFYSAEEMDSTTDWRIITLLDMAQRLRGGPKTPGDITVPAARRLAKQPSSAASRSPARSGGIEADFIAARQAMRENPGDKTARRNYFRLKVARDSSRR